jgi:hypothetical protein
MELAFDLTVERQRLEALIDSLVGLAERCLFGIVRVLNGGTSEGVEWRHRLLDRLTLATEHRAALLSSDSACALGLLQGFRNVLRHLQADVLLAGGPPGWPKPNASKPPWWGLR